MTQDFVSYLYHAERERSAVSPITQQLDGFDLPKGYEIQREGLKRRLEDGAKLIGYKMGLTSLAKQADVGVDAPICGYLLSGMEHSSIAPLQRDRFIHPRVEPEIVMRFSKDVSATASREEILSAIESISLGVEILDSRFEKFKFKLPDVVADNTSAAGFVVGNTDVKAHYEDVRLAGVVVKRNEEVLQTGAPAAVLGDPLLSVQKLLAQLQGWGESLKAGMVVLTGGITASVPFEAGDRLEFVWPFERIELTVQ